MSVFGKRPAKAGLITRASERLDLLVRDARASDASALQTLYETLVGSGPRVRPERLAEIERDADTLLLVAEIQGQVAGTALVCFCRDPMYADRPFALVENVVVSPSARSMGVARAIFRRIDEAVLARRATKIMLMSGADRSGAHEFFERAGYRSDLKRAFVRYRSEMARGPGRAI